jgi:IS30 family transposase
VLNRSPSIVSRELKRNAPAVYKGYYLAHRVQQRADIRKHQSHRRNKLKNDFIRGYVEKHIGLGWSPELILGRLSIEHPDQRISHETIYQWIYIDAAHLTDQLLVRAHHRRKHRGYSRKQNGHWETANRHHQLP